ncbi:MAG: class I SAM-dependent methyltransferase [Bacteroidota bacterium]
MDRKGHWETVYQTKQLSEVSWFEPIPQTSLEIINDFRLPKNAAIIDIGGGDSLMADHLIALGYTNITVLDISGEAIERAKKRLGESAGLVTWIVSDILLFDYTQKYDLWHDRATFHFLTERSEQQTYLKKMLQSLLPNAYITLSTFAIDGPQKCSGLQIQQYSERTLAELFGVFFEKLDCFHKEHTTPFNTKQEFIYCSFQNKLAH